MTRPPSSDDNVVVGGSDESDGSDGSRRLGELLEHAKRIADRWSVEDFKISIGTADAPSSNGSAPANDWDADDLQLAYQRSTSLRRSAISGLAIAIGAIFVVFFARQWWALLIGSWVIGVNAFNLGRWRGVAAMEARSLLERVRQVEQEQVLAAHGQGQPRALPLKHLRQVEQGQAASQSDDSPAPTALQYTSTLNRLNRAAAEYEKLWQMTSALLVPLLLVLIGWLMGR